MDYSNYNLYEEEMDFNIEKLRFTNAKSLKKTENKMILFQGLTENTELKHIDIGSELYIHGFMRVEVLS